MALTCNYWLLAGFNFGPRGRYYVKLALIVTVMYLLATRYIVWDEDHLHSAGIVRPLLCECVKSVVRLMGNLAIELWAVPRMLEQIQRSFALFAGPFQLLTLAGCVGWSEVGLVFLVDWLSFASRLWWCCLLDHADMPDASAASEGAGRDTGKRSAFVRVRAFVIHWGLWAEPHPPTHWCTDLSIPEARVMYRRFVTMLELQATTGICAGALAGCAAIAAVADIGSIPLLEVYMPACWLSLGFIFMLFISELLQDYLAYIVLVRESFRAPRWRLVSLDAKAYVKSRLYPPVFDSRAQLIKFALPLLCTAGYGSAFVWGPVSARVYKAADRRYDDLIERQCARSALPTMLINGTLAPEASSPYPTPVGITFATLTVSAACVCLYVCFLNTACRSRG